MNDDKNPTPWLQNGQSNDSNADSETSAPTTQNTGQTFQPKPQETVAPQTPTQSDNPSQTPAPSTPPPVTPPQSPIPGQTDNIPDYLQGSAGPPPAGQSLHPAGKYQPKPGEYAQASSAGVGVVQNVSQNYSAPSSKKKLSTKQLIIILVALLVLIGGAILAWSLMGSSESDDQAEVANYDSQLQQDLDKLKVAMADYAEDNDGNYPKMELVEIKDFASNYLPSNFLDPRTEEPYQLVTEKPAFSSEIQYLPYGVCGENGTISAGEDESQIALRVTLSDGSLYCVDNSEEQDG